MRWRWGPGAAVGDGAARAWWPARATVALAVVGVAAVAGCGGGGSTDVLRFGGPGAPKAFGADVDLVPGQRGESFGSFNLCLAGPGRATVTGVEAVSAHGVRVATWSVRDGEAMGLGTSPNGLVAEGFPRDPAPVRVVCPREGGKDPGVFPSELGVRLELDGVSGSATGLRVRYEADGRDGVLVIPFTVRMAPA